MIYYKSVQVRLGGIPVRRGGALALSSEKEGGSMVTYVILMKLTDQGIRTSRTHPAASRPAFKGFEATGGQA